MPPTVLRVALPVPRPGLFDYLPDASAPADAGWIGCRVRVPFGRRELIGVVAEIGPAAAATLRPIEARLDARPLFDAELWATLGWAARYYHAPLGEMLATALPARLRAGAELPPSALRGWQLTEAGCSALGGLRRGRPQRLAALLAGGPQSEAALDLALPDWRPAARNLVGRGLLERSLQTPLADTPLPRHGPPLSAAQQAAVDAVTAAAGRFQPVLLDGVTGSGKTEVYLEAIADCLARGRQALVLVPEIGLTPQTLRRFRARLGVPVAALHSGLADGERARVWAALARGEARLLVGTRSAIFSPLPEAGLIVIDEEHDGSYKQQDGVRYSARDLALLRGKALGVPVLLGSATPALETLAAARSGRYLPLRLAERAGGAKPPIVRVIDLRRRSLEAGLSPELLAAIDACLARGEQALVFRNRRGYAPVLLCHDCGWSAQCRRCDAALTVHGGGRRLLCHHCGVESRPPPACPDCGGLGLQPQGAGTERIEEALTARFPGARTLRIDRETTRGRDALAAHLEALGDQPGILIGTQMLAKGHDLPKLSLVAVVGVDEGLFSADFRAAERLAQLLIQVAGRAGRADRPGEVLLQTHHPTHPLLLTLLAGGYPLFAETALAEREAAGFPPFGHLALLRAEAPDEAPLKAFLGAARAQAAVLQGGNARVALNGPLPAPMLRRAGRYRWQLLLSAPQRPPLQALLGQWVPWLYDCREARRVRWSVDVDPLDLY
jgi:primosomal protein N' (replication factor Y) (superfamily II helicase)